MIVIVSVLTLSVVALFQYDSLFDGKLHIYVCDVGQGDGILIQTPERKYILFDATSDGSLGQCLSTHMPFWIHTIDIAVLSDLGQNHLLGMKNVIKR